MTSEWWTYRLSDFLLFSPRTYYRLFELYNREVWPAQFVAIAAGVVILILAARRKPWSGRVVSVTLGVAWLWVAWGFHLQRYATINWAAKWFAVAFAVEGLLLICARLQIPSAMRATQWIGAGLFVFALVIEPVLGVVAGRSRTQIELIFLAPDPTTVGSLGALLFLGERFRAWLLIIPILWCAVSGATLWALNAPDALVLPVTGLLVLALVAAQATRRWLC